MIYLLWCNMEVLVSFFAMIEPRLWKRRWQRWSKGQHRKCAIFQLLHYGTLLVDMSCTLRTPSSHVTVLMVFLYLCLCVSLLVSAPALVSLSCPPLRVWWWPLSHSSLQRDKKKKKLQSVRQPPSNSLELPYRVDASYRRSILNLPQARSPLRRIGTNKVVRCGALMVPVGQNESVDEQGLALLMKMVVVFRFFG